MRVGIRGRLFLASIGLLVLSLAAAEVYLLPAIEADLTARIREDLRTRLHLVAERAASEAAVATSTVDWDALADKLASLAKARVTFVGETGEVLGDSEVGKAGLSNLENHRQRVEVAAAFDGTMSDSIRYSATTHQRMIYAAAPVPGGAPIVARLSLPLAWVDSAKARVRTLLLIGTLVAMLAALLLGSAAAVVLSRNLRRLAAVARRMAAGDLQARSRLEMTDEIGELGRTLDHLAANLLSSVRELRDDRDLLGRILESMREGVLVMDGEHRILLANPSIRHMLLLDSDLVGRSTMEVLRNADLQSIIERASVGSEPVVGEIDVGGIRPRKLMVHASRLSGEPRALLLVLFDVTEMRRLETIRRDFVANVSHELRTPIASVQSAAETLRMAMDHDPRAAEQFLDIIERNARRLGELISDLLDLSRIEAKEVHLRREELDLHHTCREILAAFEGRAASRKIKLTLNTDQDEAKAVGDEHAVGRVLSNLVDNALKYCPEASAVTVTTQTLPATIRVLVSDNGPGIEAKHLPRLFERFYRVDAGRSRDMGGTGLGLSIVKHLVEAMNGEVTVDSSPQKGSTFAFTLPRATTNASLATE